MTPISSYQEELETVENPSSTSIEKIVRIIGTEENSFSPNSIYVRTFDKVTFVNLDGSNGGTNHAISSVKIGTSEPDGTFYSGLIRAGQSFKTTITEPGIYEYFDPMFPNIRGTIHVV
jgi:plastocyanin